MPSSTNQRAANGVVGVALIDAVPLVREGLSAFVHRTPGLRWVGAAEHPAAGLRLCERLRPDVVVVDAAVDPHGQLTQLLAGHHGIVLMVDETHLTTQDITKLVARGVRAIIRRAAQPPQLLQAIQAAVHADGRYLDPVLAASPPVARPRRHSGLRQPLSQRELEVLRLVADGLENQSIADTLFVSVETIRTHVKSILRKLASRDRTHAVAVAFRSGVLAVDDDIVPHSRTGSEPT
ncbi:response regulator transcription factor [Actinophytocola sp.]|uniref:response regulator transcription factor n=1 Tax=Actinophytocola sp. TaxID=1872138 RepID=UPI002ED1B390